MDRTYECLENIFLTHFIEFLICQKPTVKQKFKTAKKTAKKSRRVRSFSINFSGEKNSDIVSEI